VREKTSLTPKQVISGKGLSRLRVVVRGSIDRKLGNFRMGGTITTGGVLSIELRVRSGTVSFKSE